MKAPTTSQALTTFGTSVSRPRVTRHAGVYDAVSVIRIQQCGLKGAGAITRSITVGDRSDAHDLVRAVATTGLQPVIDEVFDFCSARAAFDYLRQSNHLGKIVIRVS
jgi:D-arabinose 1-dehydrogenase-like Zn-dependent alcohol dehydrogenase